MPKDCAIPNEMPIYHVSTWISSFFSLNMSLGERNSTEAMNYTYSALY